MEQNKTREVKLVIGNALIIQPTGVVFLGQNNKYAYCPFRPPLVVQEFVQQDIVFTGKSQEPIVENKIQEQACGDWCPHFSITRTEKDGSAEVRLTCGSAVIKKINQIIDNSKPKENNL